ncbi:MAG: zinc metallopeptidase [Verrucomicrobiales bacterium]|nr:zinc metallopeptidase [Verrucomicrobiales bacterium]
MLGFVLLISMVAKRRVARVCARQRDFPLKREMTGARAARAMLESEEMGDTVRVVESRGMLPDAYDASKRIVYLRSVNYHGTGATAVGVAAHETAHALQHRDSFTALNFRLSAIKLAQVVSGMVLVGAVAGAFLLKYPPRMALMVIAGSWAVFLVMNLMTLPVEFEASKRAKRLLRKLAVVVSREEGDAVGKVLFAMALANVGAMLSSVPYLVYHLLPGFGRKAEVGVEAPSEEKPVKGRVLGGESDKKG